MKDANVQAKTRTQAKVNTQAQVELSKGAILAASAVPAVVGLWAAACFVGGLVASGGPVSMVQSFFSAVAGI